jgi:hypothetical protein
MERHNSISTCTSVGLIDVVVFVEQHYYGLDIAHGPNINFVKDSYGQRTGATPYVLHDEKIWED